MPNGGVPLHMVIRPKAGCDHVVYCFGAQVRVVPTAEWDQEKSAAPPTVVLDEAESRILERFLRYWLRDTGEGPVYREPGVRVEFDF